MGTRLLRPLRSPRGPGLARLALLAALALAPLAGWPSRPAAAQSNPGPLAPPVAATLTPTPSPQGAETPQQTRQRVLVEALRHRGAWSELRATATAKVIEFIPAAGAALIILIGFYILYRVTARLLHGLMRRSHAHPAVLEIGVRLTKFVILAFGIVMAASQLGFQVGSVLAGLGIAGLAVGLAAQDSLANLVAGITILWDHPFRIGDHVTIAGTYGTVKEIGLRTTRILTVEHIDAVLPNKDVINQEILNHTLSPDLRLGIPVGIGYEEDVREARRVLLAAVEGHPMIKPEPPPKVVVTGLGESAVNIELRVWLRDAHQEREAFFALTELVKLTLDEAGIEIPFPQRTIRFAGHAGDLPPQLAPREEGGEERERPLSAGRPTAVPRQSPRR